MKSINLLYEGKESLNRLIEQEVLKSTLPYFIQIISASEEPREAVKIAGFVQESLPNATIMGYSSSGIIYKGEYSPEGTLIIIHLYENIDVFQACFTWEGKSAKEVAIEIASSISNKSYPLMHIIFGNLYYDIHDFVEEFNKCNQYTSLAGGIAGEILSKNIPGYVFTPEGVVENGIVIAALSGSDYTFYNGINSSHEPISGKHKLTKIKNGAWKEINGQDINQWLSEQLALENLDTLSKKETAKVNKMLVRFPMILEGYQNASRFLLYDEKSKEIKQYFSEVPEGTEFRIGYVNPTECVHESFSIYNDMMSKHVENLFCYTCLLRYIYLKSCSEWEISHYKNIGLCGAFLLGEIANSNGHNEFLNGSCCFLGIAENEAHIRPEIKSFEGLASVEEDLTAQLNVVLKRQQETTTRENEKLMKDLIKQQKNQKEQQYIDFNTGFANYLKYKEDLKSICFNKMCVVKIENAELLITHLGHASYLKILRNVLSKAQNILNNLKDREHALLELYVFNESTFFVAADERMSRSHFTRICRSVHDSSRLSQAEEEEVVVSRFVVCLHLKKPIGIALNALAASKNTQNSFLICDKKEEATSSREEFKMIGVLNRAFDRNGVVPYFQGIYCNKNKKISYYEGLMRIIDTDGTIYGPGQFIEIAKKYHMYTNLSRIMLNKIFDLFSYRDEKISMNISAFDIHSDETKEMIYEKLKACKSPANFVFEILEDEAYQDFSPLKEFIVKIRELGAKVAIDDFGAGYSNLCEIANISFDIIKVDGSIVCNLPNNECNQKLLNVITYMGLLFDAEIVAEFVENQEIQNIIEKMDISYSQGYLFAKPLPFDELNL